jgi:hypothetical protein
VVHQHNYWLHIVGIVLSIEHSTGWRNRDGWEDNSPRGLGPVVSTLVEVEHPGLPQVAAESKWKPRDLETCGLRWDYLQLSQAIEWNLGTEGVDCRLMIVRGFAQTWLLVRL